MWIFGYGSLIWKAGFEFVDRREGYIEGWARRFWQDSTDHRGVPSAPGRVVTLVPDPAARTWGAAYRIDPAVRGAVLAQLDHREKGGYERHRVTVRGVESVIADEAIIYIGTAGNPNWGGPLPLEEIAAIVARAEGPSGANLDYLLNLYDSLQDMGAEDEHIEALVRLLELR